VYTPREDEILLLVGVQQLNKDDAKNKTDVENGYESLDSAHNLDSCSEGDKEFDKEQMMKRRDSPYFLEIRVDEAFLRFLNDPKILDTVSIYKKLIFITRNKNFIHLVLNELQERR